MQRRTTVSLPWLRPVRVVRLPDGEGAAGERTQVVEVGVDLPGVFAVEVTTVRCDGLTVLIGLHPIPSDEQTVGPPRLLHELLDEIADVDGSVAVGVTGSMTRHGVLDALARVQSGTTVTYSELAARAGVPRAVRAVARVMSTNRVPLLLPCHRVVPMSGGLGRYGWGADVKAALLALEGAT